MKIMKVINIKTNEIRKLEYNRGDLEFSKIITLFSPKLPDIEDVVTVAKYTNGTVAAYLKKGSKISDLVGYKISSEGILSKKIYDSCTDADVSEILKLRVFEELGFFPRGFFAKGIITDKIVTYYFNLNVNLEGISNLSTQYYGVSIPENTGTLNFSLYNGHL
jgi:hypothetical protein